MIFTVLSFWPKWNLHRSEFHFAWSHVNTDNEVTLHRNEISPRSIELRYGGNRVLTLCPEVKYQAGLSSLRVSCKRALKKRFQHRYFLCEYREVFKSSFFCIEHYRRLLLMKQCRIQSHFEAGIPVWIPISNPQMLKTVDFWCKQTKSG